MLQRIRACPGDCTFYALPACGEKGTQNNAVVPATSPGHDIDRKGVRSRAIAFAAALQVSLS
jgi:hypothetical protein